MRSVRGADGIAREGIVDRPPMATALKTTVTELPESRVRVEAEVAPDEVQRRVEQKARSLGAGLKIPGFRKGHVPPPVVIKRIGREAVLDETVRDSLGNWYVQAIDAAGIAPVGDPELALGELPAEGEALRFTIEIGVRPRAVLGDYEGLEVGRREPVADEQAVSQQLEDLRDRLARLETVERAAGDGDFLVIDYEGTIDGEPIEGGHARDQLIELGSGRLIPGFEAGLRGAQAGDTRELELTFPDDYGAAELAGKQAKFDITVKEVKEKRLPELDDDLASDAAGFDTLDELRDDVRTRLLELDERRVEQEFREAVVDAAVAHAQIDVPEALVEARAAEAWERTLHSLSHQGVSREAYLQIAGKSEQQVLEEARPDAERSLRREALLAAVIEQEGIEPGDDELLAAIEAAAPVDASQTQQTPEQLLDALRKSGRIDALREDVAARSALDLLAGAAKPIPLDQAQARDKLWTPEKEAAQSSREGGQKGGGAGAGKLWTPGR
jgi:trigger factor